MPAISSCRSPSNSSGSLHERVTKTYHSLVPTPDLRQNLSGGVGVSGATEEVSNLIVNGEKALRLPGGFEPLHDPLAPSGRLMAVLGPIVQAFMLPMLHTRHNCLFRGGVAGQLVGDHHPRSDALPLEPL